MDTTLHDILFSNKIKNKKNIQANPSLFVASLQKPKLPRETRSLKVFLHLPNGRRGDVDAGDLLISRGMQFRWEGRISATNDQEIPGTITSHGTKLFKGILGVAGWRFGARQVEEKNRRVEGETLHHKDAWKLVEI